MAKPNVSEAKPEQQTMVTINALPHSVEISRTSSGVVTIGVKVYGDSPAAAFTEARRIFDEANKLYPYGKP